MKNIKECCYNCHAYLGDYENCQGEKDIHEDSCHKYVESKYMSEEDFIYEGDE